VAAFEVLAFLSAHPGVDQGLPLARGAVESATLSLQTELREVDVSTTDSSSTTSAPTPGVQRGEMRLEVVILPVSDVDRAKDFYVGLGWRLDADFTTPEGLRVVQVTPPGSQASVNFGTKVSSSEPGSVQSLILSVYHLDETRTELIARGAEVSEMRAESFSTQGPGAASPVRTPRAARTGRGRRSATPTATAGCCRRSSPGCPGGEDEHAL
jgi:catechol 2,3-dioxygenase-like lactoylglutathione lyase family enzyme